MADPHIKCDTVSLSVVVENLAGRETQKGDNAEKWT
jgi:hypothetical protein